MPNNQKIVWIDLFGQKHSEEWLGFQHQVEERKEWISEDINFKEFIDEN